MAHAVLAAAVVSRLSANLDVQPLVEIILVSQRDAQVAHVFLVRAVYRMVRAWMCGTAPFAKMCWKEHSIPVQHAAASPALSAEHAVWEAGVVSML